MPYAGSWLVMALLLCGCWSVNGQGNLEERLHLVSETISRMIKENSTMANMWQDHLKLFQTRQKRATFDFPCNLPGTVRPPPSSAHDLRPEDIRVVGAMGDSLTSANGALAWTWYGIATQDRGRSWSIGGDRSFDRGVLTLPNILRKYVPTLKGFSTGSIQTALGYGGRNATNSRLNVAEAYETSVQLPMQARILVDRIHADSSINITNDWKMVTVFIGGNDICAFCNNSENDSHNSTMYVRNIEEALDILHDALPRTFVNLVEMFEFTTPIAQFLENFFCDMAIGILCNCFRDPSKYPMIERTVREYQRGLQDLIASRRYDTRNDFTVVLQPFLRDSELPMSSSGRYDLSYFAPDCFHWSEKGHQSTAATLWNTMLQPLSQKITTGWNGTMQIRCPEDYGRQTFATHLN